VRVLYEHEQYKGSSYFNIACGYRRQRLGGVNTATAAKQKLHVGFDGTLPLNLGLSSSKAKALCPEVAEMSLSLPFTEDELGNAPEAIEEYVAP
jgi:hypothetical protein